MEPSQTTVAIPTFHWDKSQLEKVCIELQLRNIPHRLQVGSISIDKKFAQFIGGLVTPQEREGLPSGFNAKEGKPEIELSQVNEAPQAPPDLHEVSRKLKSLVIGNRKVLLAVVSLFVFVLIIRNLAGESEPFSAVIDNCTVDEWDGSNQNVHCDVTGYNRTSKPEQIYISFKMQDSQGFEVDGPDDIELVVPAKGSKTEKGVYLGWFITNGTYGVEPPYSVEITEIRMLDVRDR